MAFWKTETNVPQTFASLIRGLQHSVNSAMDMLESRNVEIPLARIAEKSGIKSSSTFYRNFVAVTGMTPADYRKSLEVESDTDIDT